MSIHRRLTLAVAAIAFLGASSSLTLSASAASGGDAGDPFDDSTQRVFASKSSSQSDPTGLYELTPGPSSYSFTSIGGDADLVYNALTFNPDDNYLYAISGNPLGSGVKAGSLLKIGEDGDYEVVGSTQYTDPDDASKQIYIGAIDTDSDTFYVMNGDPGNPSQLIVVPLGGGAAPAPVALSQTWDNVGLGSDFTFSNGFLWSLGDDSIARIDPSNGDVDTYSVPAAADSSNNDQAGAAWTFRGGDLGFSYNGSGTVIRIHVTNPSAGTPTFAVVSAKAGSGSGQNDGAAIPGDGIDLELQKTGSLLNNGKQIRWTLTGKNNGSGASPGWTITDTLPAGLANVTASGDGSPQVSGNTVTASGAFLAEGDTVTVTITADVTSSAVSPLRNTALIAGADEDEVASNNADTAAVTLPKPAPVKCGKHKHHNKDGKCVKDKDDDDSDDDDDDNDKKLPSTGAPWYVNPWTGLVGVLMAVGGTVGFARIRRHLAIEDQS